MIDDLMRDPAVILQDVVVFGAGGAGDAFRDGLFPPTEHQPGHIPHRTGLFEALEGRGEGEVTKISRSCSSGISVSFAPWCLGMTSCVDYSIRIACNSKHRTYPPSNSPVFCSCLCTSPTLSGERRREQSRPPPEGMGTNQGANGPRGGRVIMEKRRETYGVPTTQRLDVEEGEEVRRFEELEGGDFSCGIECTCTVSKRA
jgi:hypothetical protein